MKVPEEIEGDREDYKFIIDYSSYSYDQREQHTSFFELTTTRCRSPRPRKSLNILGSDVFCENKNIRLTQTY